MMLFWGSYCTCFPNCFQDDGDDRKKKVKKPRINLSAAMGGDKAYFDKIEGDRGTRFNFLLSQTEIFSHFLNAAGRKPPTSPLKMKKMPDLAKAAKGGGSSSAGE